MQVRRKSWLNSSSHPIDTVIATGTLQQCRSIMQKDATSILNHVFNQRDARLIIETDGKNIMKITIIAEGINYYEFTLEDE